MSNSSHRSIARIPLQVFTDLIMHRDDNPYSPSDLRDVICKKLLDAGRSMSSSSTSNGNSNNFHSSANAQSNLTTDQGITTVGQLMRMVPTALLRVVDPLLTIDECYKLIARISQICTPKPKTAQVLYLQQKNQCIPLDVIGIDQCLRGGVRIGTLTEIVGRAGIGKTQMVMQLCVVAARLGYGSIFVDTERKLSLQRLYEIARERAKSSHGRVPSNMIGSSSTNMNSGQDGFDYSGVVENDVGQSDHFATDGSNSNHDYKSPLQVMNNITVHTPASTEELLAVVSRLDEEIIVRSHASSTTITPTSNGQQIQALPVKLIILDSIAAPTRKDFGGGSATERAAAIFQLAQTLKRVADEMQVAIVVINQIDTAYSGEVDQTFDNDVSCVKAALGISWYHCVSTRIALEHKLNRSQTGMRDLHPSLGISSSIRTATIVKSNLVGKQQALFEVTTKGVCHVDG